MKKIVAFMAIVLIATLSLNAQIQNYSKAVLNNATRYIERVEEKISLSEKEKETVFQLKCEHSKRVLELKENYGGTPEFDIKRKEFGKQLNKSLIKNFGKKRAKEISEAARPQKKRISEK